LAVGLGELRGVPRWNFADRLLRGDSDGDAFELFAIDAISGVQPSTLPFRRLARGRDGAVDIIIEADGDTTVCECKFIGDGEFETARARWREVAKRLRKHLPELAADPSDSPNSPYRFWLDQARPIRRYVFGVTARLTNLEAGALSDEIRELFRSLSADPALSLLRHLAEDDGAVQVLSWDHFAAILEGRPALTFKWFGGLPTGARLLATEREAAKGFRAFLYGGTLPFFSREAFLIATRQRIGADGLDAEETIVAELAGEQPAAGLIVAGPGGVGKTRLSLELAHRLEERGWLPILLSQVSDDTTIRQIIARHRDAARLTFVLDYAEAAASLARIADAVRVCGDEGGHRVRLIVTCRASALHAVADALLDLSPRTVHLGAAESLSAEYAAWVCGQILRQRNLPDIEGLTRICSGVPALAAFAVFLHDKHPEQFDAQFTALHETTDFDSWCRRRVGLLCQGSPDHLQDRRLLADLALSLPMPIAYRDRMVDVRQRSGALLEKLEADRWIEHASDHVVPAHDVLTDALAAQWVFTVQSTANSLVRDALRRAITANRLVRALRVLDRLAAHPGFAWLDGGAIARELLQADEDQALLAAPALLGGRLLNEAAKLLLLRDFPSLRSAAAKSPSTFAAVSTLAEFVAELATDDPMRLAADALYPILDAAIAVTSWSNIILRRAYRLSPARYRVQLLGNIDIHPFSSQTHFALVALLRAGEDPSTLSTRVQHWLSARGASDLKASFVYQAWLDAKGDLAVVAPHVPGWIETHGKTLEASFVYQAWLDAKGDLAVVAPHVRGWIETHGKTLEARFVYQAWLDAKGDLAVVAPHVRGWIETHGKTLEASFVYQAWLDAKGDLAVVAPHVPGWIETHGKTLEAQFVYRAWLERGKRCAAARLADG
jgi:hypothetical protein